MRIVTISGRNVAVAAVHKIEDGGKSRATGEVCVV